MPEQYDFGSDISHFKASGDNPPPEFGTAYRIFSDLARWVDEDYAMRIPSLHNQWQVLEEASFRLQPALEDYVRKQWDIQPAFACELLSRYCHGVLARAVQQASELMVEKYLAE